MANASRRFTHCVYCDTPLPIRLGPGRPQKYCKPSHRQRHYEALRRGISPFEIGERDGWECYLCGDSLNFQTLVLDHVDPVSKGGPDAEWNLRACCKPCNSRKAGHGYYADQARLPL